MATLITKNSSTAAAVPGTGDLVQGELAVNVTDKKLYTKDSGGNIVKIVGSLGNQEADAPAFTGPISANGSTGTSGQILTSQGAGSPAQWSTPPRGLTLLATITPGAGTTTAAATGLAAYESFIIVTNGVTLSSGTGTIAFALSSDNGSTYGSSITVAQGTTPSFNVQLYRVGTSSIAKPYFYTSSSDPAASARYTTTTGIINAVRLSAASATFTGTGVAYVYGMG